MRKTGKAAPKQLTTHQKQIVQRLLDAHGEDVEVRRSLLSPLLLAAWAAAPLLLSPSRASQRVRSQSGSLSLHPTFAQAWFRDIKLNRMQHSEGRLREMLASFRHHAGTERHDFRAPRKPPAKL